MALLNVLDGDGLPQTRIVPAQGTATNRSGSIAVAGASQQLMAANPNRSGWLIQNTSPYPIEIGDLGQDATLASAYQLAPGGEFPRDAYYPVTTGIVNVAGTAGSTFVAREW